MRITAGARVGGYGVLAALGAGGMGEVYRAKDTKLGRDVALKILPASFTNDPERVARFHREAQVLASLNHPHIAQIHGLEEVNGTQFLVLELVDGESLDKRIARGPIPVDEALDIARQIAEALEAAHDKGIIHRDLKPANIALTKDGSVKVLDFGLAKAVEATSGSIDAMNSPTITSPTMMTGVGVILGTAAYMAPEQAKGRPADKRSDIWAFGCVLYEMLSAVRAFGGEDVSDTLAEILKGEPDWRRVPKATSSGVRRLLRRCLEKDPRRRLRDMGDVAIELEDGTLEREGAGEHAGTRSRRLERVGWSAALLTVTVGAAALIMLSDRPRPGPETRVEIVGAPTSDPISFAISRDGRKLAFAGVSEGRSRLFLRVFDSAQMHPLPGTDGGSLPFWSPDANSVGFFADDGKLKRVDLDTGVVHTLASASLPEGGSWNRNHVILYVPRSGPIFRLAAGGGEPVPVTKFQPGHSTHALPSFLPDDRHFLYFVQASSDARGVYVGDLNSLESRRLFDADSPAVYVESGEVLFVRQGRLYAQRFDPDRLVLSGEPVPIAEQIAHHTLASVQGWAFAASDTGTIVYRNASADARRQFAWFDRSGRMISTVGQPDDGSPASPSLSPDGRRLAFHRSVNGNVDVWLLDLLRGVLTRFTTDPANDIHPIWSPDGTRIVFGSNRRGMYDLYEQSLAGAGAERISLRDVENVSNVADWSADGRLLLFQSRDLKTSSDIWVLPLAPGQKPLPVIRTEFEERDPQFSPDGKWIAYQSTDSGRPEIYVQPFPGRGARTQISTTGGTQVRWRPDMKEVFYVALDERLMSVPVTFRGDSGSVDAGAPVPLFLARLGGALQPGSRQQYVVSPDGQRFLMNTITGDGTTSPIAMILNWQGHR